FVAHRLQGVGVCLQYQPRLFVGGIDHLPDLVVDVGRDLVGVVLLTGVVPPRNPSPLGFPYCIGPRMSLIPYSITILRAMAVAFSMSFAAPVVGSAKMISSAVRPPSSMANWSTSSERRTRYLSCVGRARVCPSERPRATLVTLCPGSELGRA